MYEGGRHGGDCGGAGDLGRFLRWDVDRRDGPKQVVEKIEYGGLPVEL